MIILIYCDQIIEIWTLFFDNHIITIEEMNHQFNDRKKKCCADTLYNFF